MFVGVCWGVCLVFARVGVGAQCSFKCSCLISSSDYKTTKKTTTTTTTTAATATMQNSSGAPFLCNNNPLSTRSYTLTHLHTHPLTHSLTHPLSSNHLHLSPTEGKG